jgi:hypothetical protein
MKYRRNISDNGLRQMIVSVRVVPPSFTFKQCMIN